MNNDECKVEITKRGLELKGKCTSGLIELLSEVYNESKQAEAEIFSCGCLDPDTMEIKQALIKNVGEPRSVSTNGIDRYCPENTIQIAFHTHPTSGQAKFSPKDGKVIVDRFNRDLDDVHCLIGENEFNCIGKILLHNEEDQLK